MAELVWGPWQTHTGLRASDGDELRNGYPFGIYFDSSPYTGEPCGPLHATQTTNYQIHQSFAAYGAGQLPSNYSDARVCALIHARDMDPTEDYFFWSPGLCPAVTTGPYDPRPLQSPFGNPTQTLLVGTSTGYFQTPLYLNGQYYTANVTSSKCAIEYAPEWYVYGYQPRTEEKCISYRAKLQIPGWKDAILAGLPPQIEVLRVDGEITLSMSADQPRMANPFGVTAHPMPPTSTPWTTAPYSQLGAAQFTFTAGGTPQTVTFPDMQLGEYHGWHLASSAVTAGTDPGANEENLASVTVTTDSVWDVRIRFLVPEITNVCRWLQRDDGLGVTAAARARTGTSLQRGNRHRGYR